MPEWPLAVTEGLTFNTHPIQQAMQSQNLWQDHVEKNPQPTVAEKSARTEANLLVNTIYSPIFEMTRIAKCVSAPRLQGTMPQSWKSR